MLGAIAAVVLAMMVAGGGVAVSNTPSTDETQPIETNNFGFSGEIDSNESSMGYKGE